LRILHSIEEMRAACRAARAEQRLLGFVPTMGALHAGHLSLVRASRQRCPTTAVSIFVNPLQFGPKEDFSRYPRNLAADQKLLESEGVELLFVPSIEEMYPPGATTYITVEGLSERLCGRFRPGHFRGVATVVAKLFQMVQPDIAYFGQKDAAQVAVIRKMTRDLDMDVEISVCPIVREADGLALSSRNAYLSPEQRKQALAIYRALCRVQTLADRGEASAEKLVGEARSVLAEEPGLRVEYVEMVHPETLEAVGDISRGALAAISAWAGGTRLIDNIVLHGAGAAR
jgi:pantoate--beta-alanine ligase